MENIETNTYLVLLLTVYIAFVMVLRTVVLSIISVERSLLIIFQLQNLRMFDDISAGHEENATISVGPISRD
jgi:hypothetical protein